jgi:hypothetical protein
MTGFLASKTFISNFEAKLLTIILHVLVQN